MKQLQRYVVICMLAVSFLGISLLMSADASDLPKLNIKIGTENVASHPVTKAITEKFAKILTDGSDGKIKVTVFPGSSLGDAQAMVEQTQLGTLQISCISETLSIISPKLAILSLPYALKGYEYADNVFDNKELFKELTSELGRSNLEGLCFMENGFHVTTNSKKPIKSLADIKGMKIRTPPNETLLAIFNAFKANVTPISFSELFSALQQGVVDGQENPFGTIVNQSLYDVQKYIAITHHTYGFFTLIANKTWLEKQPAEYQELIRKAAHETSVYQRELVRNLMGEYKKTCIERGMEITEPDLTDFYKAVEPVYEDFYKKYPDYKPLVEKLLAVKL